LSASGLSTALATIDLRDVTVDGLHAWLEGRQVSFRRLRRGATTSPWRTYRIESDTLCLSTCALIMAMNVLNLDDERQ
jgi:hypothetical protein